jgi:hypothetical protein
LLGVLSAVADGDGDVVGMADGDGTMVGVAIGVELRVEVFVIVSVEMLVGQKTWLSPQAVNRRTTIISVTNFLILLLSICPP